MFDLCRHGGITGRRESYDGDCKRAFDNSVVPKHEMGPSQYAGTFRLDPHRGSFDRPSGLPKSKLPDQILYPVKGLNQLFIHHCI